MAISLKRRPRRRLQGSTTTCNPLARAGTASRLISDGIESVEVSGAQVSVKEKFFQRGKASYKAKSSDGRFAGAAAGDCPGGATQRYDERVASVATSRALARRRHSDSKAVQIDPGQLDPQA
jgi:hypothetical protein